MVPSAATEGDGAGSLAEVAFCLGEGEESLKSPFSLCALREKVRGMEGNGAGSNGDGSLDGGIEGAAGVARFIAAVVVVVVVVGCLLLLFVVVCLLFRCLCGGGG